MAREGVVKERVLQMVDFFCGYAAGGCSTVYMNIQAGAASKTQGKGISHSGLRARFVLSETVTDRGGGL